ncbi:unnamed protein product [Closterium sp. NIES-54]
MLTCQSAPPMLSHASTLPLLPLLPFLPALFSPRRPHAGAATGLSTFHERHAGNADPVLKFPMLPPLPLLSLLPILPLLHSLPSPRRPHAGLAARLTALHECRRRRLSQTTRQSLLRVPVPTCFHAPVTPSPHGLMPYGPHTADAHVKLEGSV